MDKQLQELQELKNAINESKKSINSIVEDIRDILLDLEDTVFITDASRSHSPGDKISI